LQSKLKVAVQALIVWIVFFVCIEILLVWLDGSNQKLFSHSIRNTGWLTLIFSFTLINVFYDEGQVDKSKTDEEDLINDSRYSSEASEKKEKPFLTKLENLNQKIEDLGADDEAVKLFFERKIQKWNLNRVDLKPVENNLFKRTLSYTYLILIIIFLWWLFKWWPAALFGWATANYFSWSNVAFAFTGSILFGTVFASWDPLGLKYYKPSDLEPEVDGADDKLHNKSGPSKTAKAALALGAYNTAKARFPTQQPTIKRNTGALNVNFFHKKKNTYALTFNYIHTGSGMQNSHKQDISPSTSGIHLGGDVVLEFSWQKL
jgi:hypothetical protein